MKALGALAAGRARGARARALNQLQGRDRGSDSPRPRSSSRRAALAARLATERVDVTLPVKAEIAGRIHPISQTIDEVIAIFGEMGFRVAEGPHIEDDFHNFTALNIPPEHPARQEHDTFYLAERRDGQRKAAAHPYLAGADPHHAGAEAADPHHRARPHLPLAITTRRTRRCSIRSKGW